MLTRRTCWIFDLDGTLTEPVHDFDAMREALEIPAGELILEYLARLPPELARERYARLDALELELAETTRPQPGLVPLMQALAEREVRLGILTRNVRAAALRTLERIGVGHLFAPADVLGREEAPPKPDPGGILHLLGRWGGGPGDGVMVGDFRLDLEAGRRAGVATVHFDPEGRCRWPALTDVRVTTLGELAALLPPRLDAG